MKFLVVLFLGLSAAVAIRLGYQRGKRYTYLYEGVIAHGIPEAFEQDLAVVIKAKTHLDYLQSGEVVMKLEDISMAIVKGQILDSDRIEKLMKEEKAQTDVRDYMKKCLQSPVRFQFKGRKVEKEMTASKDDPDWCLNIKRGILNHLYLPIRDNDKAYQTIEDEVTVLGKCKTAYSIVNRNPFYRVKRVIDLTKCSQRPELLNTNTPNLDAYMVKQQGRQGGGRTQELPTFLRSAAHMDYELQGNVAKGFLIRKVVSESEHDLTMLGDQYQAGKAVAARIRQALTLHQRDQPIPSNAADAIPNEGKRGGLMYIHDDGANADRTEDVQKNILAAVEKHISTLKRQLKNRPIQPEAAEAFIRLAETLRRCTEKSLTMVMNDYLGSKNTELRDLLLDAVARVGSRDAVEVIKKLVIAGKLNDHLERVMVGLGWIRFKNFENIAQVMQICRQQNVASRPKARQACWLSLGNLVNHLMRMLRACPRLAQDTKVAAYKNNVAKVMEKTLISYYAMKGSARNALAEAVQNTKDNEEKIVYIKAVGNAGWTTEDVFKAVVAQINNKQSPLHVKVQGVWALRHMARVQPKKVRQTLLPIFANPLRDPELRIACYKILLQSDPSLLTCQMMANVISREANGQRPRSNQLVSFIASDLRTSIDLDRVDMVRASRARLLLRFLPRRTSFGAFSYSKGINIALDAVTGNKAKVEVRMHKINSRESFIPRNLNAKIRLHTPGFSANVLEVGARIQGVHDILQPFFESKNRQKRSLEILKFIFGVTADDSNQENDDIHKKLQARFSTYLKLFGSEIYYGKLAKEDLQKFIKDALFGDGTATEAGITFTKTGIQMKKDFTNAHMLSDTCYLIPTLIGIPLKIVHQIAAAVKGNVDVDITAQPQLITSQHENIKATIKVKPDVAVHMHTIASMWLPAWETALVVKNNFVVAPRLHMVSTLTKTGFNAEFPVSQEDQQIFDLRSQAQAVVRKQLTAGVQQFDCIDLQIRQRGMAKLPETCYGEQYLGLAACVKGKTPDMAYLRTKRIPAFPYMFLANLNIALKNGEDAPAKVTANYQNPTNDDQTYAGKGEIDSSGKENERKIVFEPKCDKGKGKCNVKWSIMNEKADTLIDYSTLNRIVIRHKYGEKFFQSDVTFENEGRLMRIANTWNKLPERIQDLVNFYHPQLVVLLHQYFGIQTAKNANEQQQDKKLEVRVELHDKFTADIHVDTPGLRLRRINQQLPFELPRFPSTKMDIQTMLRSRYATCHVEGTNYIKTTDNVILQAAIRGNCPYVLAKDARNDQPKWRILLKRNKEGQKELIFEINKQKIRLFQDDKGMGVEIDGQRATMRREIKLTGVRITLVNGNQLFLEAQLGFQCLFDGAQVVLLFVPWWHNRIIGLCGNNDGEQWTDFATPRKVFVPETMQREFLREWVVEAKECGDKR